MPQYQPPVAAEHGVAAGSIVAVLFVVVGVSVVNLKAVGRVVASCVDGVDRAVVSTGRQTADVAAAIAMGVLAM
jgi:hypothetical protein